MKKIAMALALLAALGTAAICAAPPKVDYAALGKENTPENSVVMIFVGVQRNFDLMQLNPKFPADHICVEKASGCTTPMRPGSFYMVDEISYRTTAEFGSPSLARSLPLPYLNGKEPEYFGPGTRIAVPEKPGLYISYMVMDAEDLERLKKIGFKFIGAATSVEELKKSSIDRFFIKNILKKAAAKYAGTPWEDEINKSLKEWEK